VSTFVTLLSFAEDCCFVTDARPRRLRSADTRTLLVSRTRTNFGDRAFTAAGPRVWYLPTDVRQPDRQSFQAVPEAFNLVSATKAQCEPPFKCALEILSLTYLGPYDTL